MTATSPDAERPDTEQRHHVTVSRLWAGAGVLWLGVWALLLWAAVGHHGGTALDSASHHGVTHSHLTLSVSWVATLVMWALMAVAMMAPTAVPMLQAYADIRHGRSVEWWLFLGGYLAVWVATASVIWVQRAAIGTGLASS